MYKLLWALSLACLVVAGAFSSYATEPVEKHALHKEAAEFFERSASRKSTLQEFGKAITEQALHSAAKKIRGEKITGDTVKLDFNVTVNRWLPPGTPTLPPKDELVPPLSECWEVCVGIKGGANQCYADCEGSRPPGVGGVILRGCSDLWQDYNETSSIVLKLRYLQKLITLGCVHYEQVELGVQLPFLP
jgi:hypothetical protein